MAWSVPVWVDRRRGTTNIILYIAFILRVCHIAPYPALFSGWLAERGPSSERVTKRADDRVSPWQPSRQTNSSISASWPTNMAVGLHRRSGDHRLGLTARWPHPPPCQAPGGGPLSCSLTAARPPPAESLPSRMANLPWNVSILSIWSLRTAGL